MKLFGDADAIREWSDKARAGGETIGFVPTMGYLHEGHLSLVDRARQEADLVAVGIFVNPTQFGPNEDFDAYPRDTERDLGLCRERGVDAVYMPDADSMYPEGYATYVSVEGLGDHLCGARRPGHFRGVNTVVTKLLNAVKPDVAVIGIKDAQQARIIQRMVEDLQFGIRIVVAPIVREADGLAISSRNVRLSPEHRSQATALHKGLREAKAKFEEGERDGAGLMNSVSDTIGSLAPEGVIDYIELVDWKTLRPVDSVTGPCLLAVAVKFADVRLIDNVLLEP